MVRIRITLIETALAPGIVRAEAQAFVTAKTTMLERGKLDFIKKKLEKLFPFGIETFIDLDDKDANT
jgi:hypothetical protein